MLQARTKHDVQTKYPGATFVPLSEITHGSVDVTKNKLY